MYKLRIKIFLVLIHVVFLALVGRLFQLQITQGQRHREEYDRYLQRTELLPGRRGKIMDRMGRILAADYPCHDLCLDYGLLVNNKRWVRRQVRQISRRLGIDEDRAKGVYQKYAENTWRLTREAALAQGLALRDTAGEVGVIDRIIRRVNRMRQRAGMDVREQNWPHAIVPGLDKARSVALRAQFDSTVGMVIRPSHIRRYPYQQYACHVIGLTRQVNEAEQHALNMPADQADWLTRKLADYLDGDIIGKRGAEKMCENVLRQRRGYLQFKLSGKKLAQADAVNGGDVHLTLDIHLQIELTRLFHRLRAQQLLNVADGPRGCRNGCIVVLSVPAGEVLAMVSVPTFDLNQYGSEFPRLVKDRNDLPLLHRAVGARYPPGSTVKPIVALAGLGAGRIGLDTTFHCTGYLLANRHDAYRCWIAKLGGAHGSLSVINGLKHSCNVFFFRVGGRMGVRGLTDWYAAFGLGERPGTGLGEERTGQLPVGGPVGTAWNLSIGQGPIAVTPLHMANAMVTIARGGKFSSPLLALEGTPKRIHRDFPVNKRYAKAVRRGMYLVVNERGGTAYKIFHGTDVEELDFKVCGKTGTAEVQPHRIDTNRNGRIDTGDRIVYEGDTAWFVGFAPYENPQVAVAVVAEHAGSGGRHAGPIAREVFRICKKYGYIK